jgi:hypothetical protein
MPTYKEDHHGLCVVGLSLCDFSPKEASPIPYIWTFNIVICDQNQNGWLIVSHASTINMKTGSVKGKRPLIVTHLNQTLCGQMQPAQSHFVAPKP